MGMLAKIRRMHIRDGIPLRDCTANRALPQHHPHLAASAGNDATPNTPPARVKASSTRGPINCGNGCRPTATAASANGAPAGSCSKPCASRATRQLLPRLRLHPQMAGRAQREPQAQRLRPAHLRPRRSLPVRLGCEYLLHGAFADVLEVAHIKICASRAFWVVAYPARAMKCSSTPMPRPSRLRRDSPAASTTT